MINLSNGHSFEYLIASGAMGYYGNGWGFKFWELPLKWCKIIDLSKFTIVTKTITRFPRSGNGINTIRFKKDGIINANGLRNMGFYDWYTNKNLKIATSKYNIIASLTGTDSELYYMGGQLLREFLNIKGIEYNASCPNDIEQTPNKVISAIKGLKDSVKNLIPIGIKLRCGMDNFKILDGIRNDIEWININSVPWKVYSEDDFFFHNDILTTPFGKYGGGAISGKLAQSKNWQFLRELAAATSIPVVAPSLWEYGDLRKTWKMGAKAYGFGSIFMYYPWRPNNFIRMEEANDW